MNKNRMIEVCKQIAEDTKSDATEFDGREFNGKNVATYFGNHGAAIAALASLLQSVIEETEFDKI